MACAWLALFSRDDDVDVVDIASYAGDTKGANVPLVDKTPHESIENQASVTIVSIPHSRDDAPRTGPLLAILRTRIPSLRAVLLLPSRCANSWVANAPPVRKPEVLRDTGASRHIRDALHC